MNIKNTNLCEKANQITLTLLTYGHAKISPRWKGESINRTFSYLYYVHRGGCVIQNKNKTLKLSSGNWYLIPAGYNFEYYCEDHMEHIYFHIQLTGLDRLDILRHLKEPLTVRAEKVPDILFNLFDNSNDLLSILTVKRYIYEAVLQILTVSGISIEETFISECVFNAVKYISANLSAKLTTSEIATNSFVSKSKLTKQFRKELSMSIQEYLYSVLLSEASHLIMNTNLSFLEISERLGFSDQFYFSRRFKQKYGLSPRAYRNRTRNL